MNNTNQNTLFSTLEDSANIPLAHLIRPLKREDFLGHEELFQKYPYLASKNFRSIVLYGPSGTGKTTLAKILAKESGKEFFEFNAVFNGVPELKKIIKEIEDLKAIQGKHSLLFMDEIHRFNKAQQDSLLPYLENGTFTLIGATTEYPKVSLNKALLSRLQIIPLKELNVSQIKKILSKALSKINLTLNDEIVETIAMYSSGDARIAINTIDLAKNLNQPTLAEIKQLLIENSRSFDRDGSRHYDVISAFIKSLRGSDPQAAVYWLAVMLDGGEDPKFIARRLMIFSSEDVGNADPQALTLATSAFTAVNHVGMPEGRIILSQVTTYLASTFKSNAAYLAINEAIHYVEERPTSHVPPHLKSSPPSNLSEEKRYKYPHDFEKHFVKQAYTENKIPNFYRPTREGKEEGIKKRLENLWGNFN